MKRIIVFVAAICITGCCGIDCRAQESKSAKVQILDRVIVDLDVVSHDLELRAINKATSQYTEAVANLAIQTARAKDLARQKATEEKTDLLTYESWIKQLDSDHDNKLMALGTIKDRYLEIWSQRYGTLKNDAKALQALKEYSVACDDKNRCKGGLLGPIRQFLGICDGKPLLDVGTVRSLGTAATAMLP